MRLPGITPVTRSMVLSKRFASDSTCRTIGAFARASRRILPVAGGMEKAMKSIDPKELRAMFDEQIAEGKGEVLDVECRFCNTKYSFTPEDIL